MSDSAAHRHTNAPAPNTTPNIGAQLPGQRSFVLQSQSESNKAAKRLPSPDAMARTRALDAGVMQTLGLQAKLAIGAPGDKYEQEADNVAAQVIEPIDSPQAQQKAVQREALPELTHINFFASGSSSLIQRFNPPVTSRAATYQNATAIYSKTLSEFHEYAQEHADWAISPAPNEIVPADRRILRRILEFARTPDILTGCGGMTVQAIKDKGTTRRHFQTLRIYSRAVAQSVPTVEIQPKNNIDEAFDIADALKKLERRPGGPVIKTIFNQYEANCSLEDLMAAGAVDAFVRYAQRARPVLHANTGKEIESFLAFFNETGGDPLLYHGSLRHVRNYHRFQKDALEQLLANQGDTSKAKPLALILHSALDHNGAFHRDPQLTNAIKDSRNLTLMLEGKSSLSEIEHLLRPLARRYGQNNRISQVMIAGHGTPRAIELAGSVNPNTMGVTDNALDLEDPAQATRTNRFFRRLLRNMDSGPHSRVVFNACLTAANEVPGGLDPDPAIAAGQINTAISNNPSLTTHLQDMANQRGQTVDVRGANASFNEGAALMDPATGLFDIIAPGGDDPALTSDKFTYVREGWEPEGALRAVLECWANDKPRCLQLVRDRHNTPISANDRWDEKIINAAYGIILANPDNANLINQLANVSWRFAHGAYRAECKKGEGLLWPIAGALPNKHIKTIIDALATTGYWRSQGYIRLTFRQFWMMQSANATNRNNFLGEVASMPCSEANDFLDIWGVYSELPQLLPTPANTPPESSRLKLALMGVHQGNIGSGEPSEDYLKSVIGSGNHQFPSSLNVGGLVSGLTNQQTILDSIGLGSAAAAAAAAGPGAAVPANIDTDRDQTRDFYVEPMTRRGVVKARRLNVRTRPGTTHPVLDTLPQGRHINISGRSGDWFSTDLGGTAVGFVHSRWVRLLRQP
ncbi:MAG: SH3 domain-containing protein [Cyanobacteria bacterium P01_H01_bin.58]